MGLFRQIYWLLTVSMVGSLLLLTPTRAEIMLKHNSVKCQDGEEFVIQEKMAVSVSKVPKEDLITVDTKKFQLIFYREGKPLKIYPVAIGEPKTPTPIGEWKIIHKGGNWGNGFGARWIGINVPWGIYGIHGTNKPWSIGSRSSHGCIRMFNKHVLELYGLVKLGTQVHITGDFPEVSPRRDVGRNNTGRDVLVFQYALRKAGFNPGSLDGRFGVEMENAVNKLQYYYGLAPTGRMTLNEQVLVGIR